MKKLLGAIVLVGTSTPVLAVDATPFFSVYAGVSGWSSEFSGDIGDTDTDVDVLGFDDETNTTFFVAFEHAVPFVPNIRLENTDVSTSGTEVLSEGFQFDDILFPAGSEVSTDLDLSFLDATLYYEIAMFDFGLTFRQFDAELSASASTGAGSLSESEEVDGVLPMVYVQTKIDLPLTGLYTRGNINAISYDGQSVTDYRIAVGYEIELSVFADVGVELGYRGFEIDLGDDEDYEADIEVSGAYLGASLKF